MTSNKTTNYNLYIRSFIRCKKGVHISGIPSTYQQLSWITQQQQGLVRLSSLRRWQLRQIFLEEQKRSGALFLLPSAAPLYLLKRREANVDVFQLPRCTPSQALRRS